MHYQLLISFDAYCFTDILVVTTEDIKFSIQPYLSLIHSFIICISFAG